MKGLVPGYIQETSLPPSYLKQGLFLGSALHISIHTRPSHSTLTSEPVLFLFQRKKNTPGLSPHSLYPPPEKRAYWTGSGSCCELRGMNPKLFTTPPRDPGVGNVTFVSLFAVEGDCAEISTKIHVLAAQVPSLPKHTPLQAPYPDLQSPTAQSHPNPARGPQHLHRQGGLQSSSRLPGGPEGL